MSFAMFFLAEYINMVTVCRRSPRDLFLGGWHGPFLPVARLDLVPRQRSARFCSFYVWMRWTLPRYRYDQLMSFGWKVLLPLVGRQPACDGRRRALFRGLSCAKRQTPEPVTAREADRLDDGRVPTLVAGDDAVLPLWRDRGAWRRCS